MRVEQFIQITGKNRFATTIEINHQDLKHLQNQAYKDAVSVQELLRKCIENSLIDLTTYSKGVVL